GGTLTADGGFDGMLPRLDVAGKTVTPDFRLDLGGASEPLDTTFHAVVDGTNGNTHLERVDAKLRHTPIEASGDVVSRPHVKGRPGAIDVKVRDGRIEDLLALAAR